MALPEIVIFSECLKYLGKAATASDAELGLLQLIKPLVERSVRRWLGTEVTQGTYTEFFPRANALNLRNPADGNYGKLLRLNHYPVTSIASINEDRAGRSGFKSGQFAASSLLTEGDDYYLDASQASFSASGMVVRLTTQWPAEPGSIKVTYTAGWTAEQLDGDVTDVAQDATDIKLAVIKTVAEAYNETVQQQSSGGSSGGAIKSERLGDYAVEYDVSSVGAAVMIPEDARQLLKPFRRRPLL